MAFKIVLILAIIFQFLAAGLAAWINTRYRWHSAWILISGAAVLMAVQLTASLASIWDLPPDERLDIPTWTAALAGLAISIMFLGGVALIEPLFKEIATAEKLLSHENRRLEMAVQENEAELHLARDIQRQLHPKGPPHAPGLEIAGDSHPAEYTSGDYYDYIELPDGRIGVVVADVSGHGVGPALLMADTRAYLRALCLTRSDPSEILTLANRAIAEDVADGRFVTALLACIDPVSLKMEYSSAGHLGFLLDPQGELHTLESHMLPLGALPDVVVGKSEPMLLTPGSLLLLATDGVFETQDRRRQMFGIEKAIDLVREHKEESAEHIVQVLFDAAHHFAGGAPQADDNTAVIIKIHGKSAT
ncbi:PP2C family protein-serine/threonine phosphatase [Lignipirellula cremea]|uniref:Phosphoserine phosphatase RsbU n=1 Tax=Lignipirellula cremea TaxID=2528010 RepID=A0A518DUW8_9BACT|nr:PP2C family protein-serine/threonine phosphatase [Lignipirellula cremea]QDU95624.1 Phosphoserine phosphatase RsbU [Lignipirellula cremea]